MARVTLIEPHRHPELRELTERIRSGRQGTILNIYKVLLHSPALAETWFEHINTVRWGTELSGRLREILIIRVAHLTNAAYILRQHVPRLAEPEGLSADDCAALADWRASEAFAEDERAALALADAMTETVQVADQVAAALTPHFSERQIVELAVLIASYNMHARVLQALDIDLQAE